MDALGRWACPEHIEQVAEDVAMHGRALIERFSMAAENSKLAGEHFESYLWREAERLVRQLEQAEGHKAKSCSSAGDAEILARESSAEEVDTASAGSTEP
jgi:hypothetical protein